MQSNNVNEQSGSPRDSRNAGNTTGMSVGSQVPNPVAKQTDFKTITGSNPGDHRAKASDAKLPPQPAPRAQTNDELEGVGG